MTKALVIAASEDAQKSICAGARTIADAVELAVVGTPLTGVADKAYAVQFEGMPENATAGIKAAFDASGADIVLVEPTATNKILAGTLAAQLGTAVITDVAAIEGDAAVNSYFGGIANAKQTVSGTKIYTVSATLFEAAEPTGTDTVETIAYTAPAAPLTVTGTEDLPAGGADLTKYDVVVGAGRGFQAEEDLKLAHDLAAKVNGEVGCSRPLAENVDWMARNLYIGVSGQVIAPKAYIALGISGQQQHMVGVTGAETIIAVNKDANAPVFKQCDLGFVGDLYEVVPALTAAL